MSSKVKGGSGDAAKASAPVVEPKPAIGPEAPVVVRAEDLGKRFKIFKRPLDRAWEWLGTGSRHTEFWAVRAVSFELRRGQCLGVIGANGSGKSTLLKMVTGALHPTEGACRVEGRVLSLIELGTGLNMNLSGRANVFNAAALLGFPSGFAREKIGEIEAFAELGEFFDRPVRLYSSGMRVRLAFSMFACFRPEVLMVDEALSVGDVFFQQKCAARMRELLDGGMTMVLVTHDQGAVLNLCDRALLLDHGRPAFAGDPAEALHRYAAGIHTRHKFGSRRAPPAIPSVTPPPSAAAADAPPAPDAGIGPILAGDVVRAQTEHRIGDGDMRIVAVRVSDRQGRDTLRAAVGQPLMFEVLVEAVAAARRPRVGLHLYDRFNNLVFAAGTFQLGRALPDLSPGERVVVRAELTLDVHPGEYAFGVGASVASEAHPEHGRVCDRVMQLGPIVVTHDRDGVRPFFGIARLPLTISHTRVAAGP